MLDTLELSKQLIARRSLTPEDAGCQDILIDHLSQMGFSIERMRYGNVDNLWARRGTTSPVVVFAGHTDVVPVVLPSLGSLLPSSPPYVMACCTDAARRT